MFPDLLGKGISGNTGDKDEIQEEQRRKAWVLCSQTCFRDGAQMGFCLGVSTAVLKGHDEN